MFGNTRGSNEFETKITGFLKRWEAAPEFLWEMLSEQS